MTIRRPKSSMPTLEKPPQRENIAAIVFTSDPATYYYTTTSQSSSTRSSSCSSSSSCSCHEVVLSYETEQDLRSQLYKMYLNEHGLAPRTACQCQQQQAETVIPSQPPKMTQRRQRFRSPGLIVIEEIKEEQCDENDDDADEAREELKVALSRAPTVRIKHHHHDNNNKTNNNKKSARTGGIDVIPEPPVGVVEPTSRDLDSRQKRRWQLRNSNHQTTSAEQDTKSSKKTASNTTTSRFSLTRPRLFRQPSAE